MRWLPLLLLLIGCGPKHDLPAVAWDVVVVPGCPSEADGTLSLCQWRRAAWLHHLHERGLVPAAITSGGAVHSPWVESEAIRAGAVALGVPPDRIHTETQALHTDENMAYALRVADALGYRRVAVATEGLQGRGMCAMADKWGWDCTLLPLDEDVVRAATWPAGVRTDPVPDWIPLKEREAAIAAARGQKRKPSFLRYAEMARVGRAGGHVPMPAPLEPEPSLRPRP